MTNFEKQRYGNQLGILNLIEGKR